MKFKIPKMFSLFFLILNFIIIGMNKMVINHLDRLFVTSDAATIIRESDIHHPAAKMVSMACKMQENECGDGTNLVISFAGELMAQA
jgi:T-complex protein 1 subunit theta